MLTFQIQHQEEYSRGELLLRTFLGWLYICVPHLLAMWFFSIVLGFMTIAAFFVILFSGITPDWYFEWTVKLNRWSLRLVARMLNLSDGYPAFGLEGTDEATSFDLERWQITRGEMVLRTFLGSIYVGIPHIFILYFRMIATLILTILAFFAVLFTGKYPTEWHNFNVGTLRWAARVNLYLAWLYKDYPPFTGRPDPQVGNLDLEGEHQVEEKIS